MFAAHSGSTSVNIDTPLDFCWPRHEGVYSIQYPCRTRMWYVMPLHEAGYLAEQKRIHFVRADSDENAESSTTQVFQVCAEVCVQSCFLTAGWSRSLNSGAAAFRSGGMSDIRFCYSKITTQISWFAL